MRTRWHKVGVVVTIRRCASWLRSSKPPIRAGEGLRWIAHGSEALFLRRDRKEAVVKNNLGRHTVAGNLATGDC